MTNEAQQAETEWNDCPTGEIAGLVGRLRGRRRRENLKQVTAGVSCLAIVLIAGIYAVPRVGMQDANFGGITCKEVRAVADRFLEQQLDDATVSRVEKHLASCGHCRQVLSELRQQRDLPPLPFETAWRALEIDAVPAPVLAQLDRGGRTDLASFSGSNL